MSDKQSIISATESFYSALNIMFSGDGSAMKALWSHNSDVTYMGPDGVYLIGWEQIGPEWDKQSAAKLGGRVIPLQINTVTGSDLALINCIESGENIVNGKIETVQIRSSTVFRNEGGNWKVIAHQTDKLGYMS